MPIDHQKLIQGRYEAELLPYDLIREERVPDYAFNVLNPSGLLYRPIVDEEFLGNGGQKPIWPNGKQFAVCLTHDADHISLYYFKQSSRIIKSQLLNCDSTLQVVKAYLSGGINLVRAGMRGKRKDPLHCYEQWLEAEKRYGAHSTFFFWPGRSAVTKRHHFDCEYELYDPVIFDNQRCTVAEMIQEIDRCGWEIGLHPSWYTFDDIDELRREKDVLEKIVGHEIVSIRHHMLHYDIHQTPSVQARAGFKYDSTLGFNDNIGFRFGTCYPWHIYDLESDEELPIMEIPLIIQDGAMLKSDKGMRLDEDTAFKYIEQIAETVKTVGGVLTLLWHPSCIIKPDWWNLYLRTLEYLKSNNAWFGTVRAVGEYWVRVMK